MSLYPTPHINARPQDFAKTVIMPGDPLRAKFIAENFLASPKLVNEVRGMLAYTGEYEGKTVTVMGSGMGMPSIGIYSYELYNIFGVENIIRVGSAGAMSKSLKIGDIFIAMGASTNSSYIESFKLPCTFAPIASYKLLKKACDTAETLGISYTVGNVFSSDTFYGTTADDCEKLSKMGVSAVEMEAAALYANAAMAGKNALAVLTVSDSLVSDEKPMSALERQTKFHDMITLALKSTL